MTILEKWELDHPNQKEIYAIFGDVVQSYCPRHFYDITNIDSCGNGGKHPCEECWNREFPEGIPLKRGQIRKEKIMDACNSNTNYIGTNYTPNTAHPSTVGTYLNTNNCGSRLPCGLCLITNQLCPMYPIVFGGPTCSTTISNIAK